MPGYTRRFVLATAVLVIASAVLRAAEPETVMITRPALTVQMHLLTSAQAAFIRALADGKTVAESYVSASQPEAGFDVTTAMRLILASGAFMRCVVPAAKMQGHNS